MKNIILISILYVVIIFSPKQLFSQNNSLSINAGIIHYYFDETPIVNVNHQYKKHLFNGIFRFSKGIVYDRKIGELNKISFGAAIFSESYNTSDYMNKIYYSIPKIESKSWLTLNVNYARIINLHSKTQLEYGIGISHRRGSQRYGNGYTPYYCIQPIRTNKKDFGTNIFLGIYQQISKRFFVYSKIDFLTFFYFGDKTQTEKTIDKYRIKEKPSIVDLSLNFGLGFKFGKK